MAGIYVCLVLYIWTELTVIDVQADHFRGGTISWRPTSTPNQAEFSFHMGWTYNKGPGCTEAVIGQHVAVRLTNQYWMCSQGCGSSSVNITDVTYTCAAASQAEQWEQGDKTFTYLFQNPGPLTVSYQGSAWMVLGGGKGNGAWNLETVVDLRQRSDLGRANSSPVTLSKPIYYAKFDCYHTIRIPVFDPDGDLVRCRMATGNECASVCAALPGSTLDQDTCTITFNVTSGNNYTGGGWFAVAMTVEDLPRQTITVGGKTFSPSDVLTSIPLQFVIQTPVLKQGCDSLPVFVNDTPTEGQVIVVKAHHALSLTICAVNLQNSNATITGIQILGPTTVQQGLITPDSQNRSGVSCRDLTWTPTQGEVGQHIVCAVAEDSNRRSSDPRCFNIKAWDIDPCDSGPCQHGSTCHRVGDTQFTCSCPLGYTGFTCQTDVDECASSPCQNGGHCLDGVSSYSCQCTAGYSGPQCGVETDECSSGPCQNGGSCHDQVNGYHCLCAPGYSGSYCQIDINECASRPCANGGTCHDMVNSYLCQCPAGFNGTLCQTDIDECAIRPCANGGTCHDLVNSYWCQCPAGFTGPLCQTDKDECVSGPCQNGGSCINEVNGYRCLCVPGYSGDRCQTDVDECSSGPCQNGGSCRDQVNGYHCLCAPGYSGPHCQIGVDECASGPCSHGATCLDLVNGFLCRCPPGFTGVTCQIDVDECASDPCLNGGQCVNGVSSYSCQCTAGYTGPQCGVDVDECSSGPCQNGGSCRDQVNGYHCLCAPGYSGPHCQIDIDECSSSPCQNGGSCKDLVNGFQCSCPAGYTDAVCSTDIDECSCSPCQNKATCLDHVGRYTCHCTPGFSGVNCELGTDHCASFPCQNGGQCQNGYNGYTCRCQGAWTGRNCGVLLQAGPLNDTSTLNGTWLDKERLVGVYDGCPRAVYSNCHCLIARNLQNPDPHGGDRSERDALAAMVGLPIGILLGVVSFFLVERCCSRTSTALDRSVVKPANSYFTWTDFSYWRTSRSPSDTQYHTGTEDRYNPPNNQYDGLQGKKSWVAPAVDSPQTHRAHPRNRWGMSAEDTPQTHRGQHPKDRWGMPAVETRDILRAPTNKGSTRVTNVYRATLGDTTQLRPETYASSNTDWSRQAVVSSTKA